MAQLSLRDYGFIGNQASGALVSRLGSIDWCCLPYFDSASHFGALLDPNQGGRFQISPVGDFHSDQGYVPRTNILETRFSTPTGRAVLWDWMPVQGECADGRPPVIHRKIEVVDGEINWQIHCAPRFSYGNREAHAEWNRGGVLFRAASLDDTARLVASFPLELLDGGRAAGGTIRLGAGESADLSWIWGRDMVLPGTPRLEETREFWRAWSHRCPDSKETGSGCVFGGPWHDLVLRSSLCLKLQIAHFSGSVCEAATTSLPHLSGGSRNWDHRYAWVRDSGMTIQALDGLGYRAESQALFQWLSDLLLRDGAAELQPVYTLDGGRYLPERELTFLSGYGGSRPVRVGNLSARQFQLDIYGHIMLAAAQHYQTFRTLHSNVWGKLAEIAEYVCQAWRRPDRGPWESRTKPEHWVASKVFCWVALDRAIHLARRLDQEVPNRWQEERNILHRTICQQGYDSRRRSFIRAFGEREIDGSALLIPLLGFLPHDDPRVLSTLDAIQQELGDGVLIHRSRPADGMSEADGAHWTTSFWFVSCLSLCGRVDEAADRLAELCTYATPLGLLAEQVSPSTGNPAGNFPSAQASLALINSALYVGLAKGRQPVTRLERTLLGHPTPRSAA